MRTLPLMVSLLVASAWTTPAKAQFFNRNKAKTVTPAQRVPELIVSTKTDQDERKRAAAAAEMRDFDVNQHPEIVSILADIAKTDKSVAVRQEALDSLARIRPISQLAGQTLEYAAAKDDSWKVRMQAKSALMRYNWSGFSNKKDVPLMPGMQAGGPVMSQEPPLIEAPITSPGASPRTAPRAGTVVIVAPPTAKTQAPAPTTNSGPLTKWFAPKSATPATPTTAVSVPKQPAAPTAVLVTPAPAPKSAPPREFVSPPPVVIEVVPPNVPARPAQPLPSYVLPPAAASKTAAPVVAPVAAPKTRPTVEVTEPNFRPAASALPPRPAFTTAVPQPASIVAPPKDAAGPAGPALTPPM